MRVLVVLAFLSFSLLSWSEPPAASGPKKVTRQKPQADTYQMMEMKKANVTKKVGSEPAFSVQQKLDEYHQKKIQGAKPNDQDSQVSPSVKEQMLTEDMKE